jgi:hypothetical protein
LGAACQRWISCASNSSRPHDQRFAVHARPHRRLPQPQADRRPVTLCRWTGDSAAGSRRDRAQVGLSSIA